MMTPEQFAKIKARHEADQKRWDDLRWHGDQSDIETHSDRAALIAEVERLRDERQWQPIDSAPKGVWSESIADPEYIAPPPILLLFGASNTGISVGRWAWYYAAGGRGCTDGCAWIEPVSGDVLSEYYGESPTHWMPLPEPPKGQK